jgi:hypothetical protein
MENVKVPPFSAGGTNGVAGRTGCILGVIGLYSGATGDAERGSGTKPAALGLLTDPGAVGGVGGAVVW